MRRLAILVLASLTIGCLGNAPGALDEAASEPVPAVESGPILERAGCSAVNAFGTVPEDTLTPYVPSNWTFTTSTPERGILRMFAIQCAESSTVLLGTPMFPDEASEAHHDNPDHIVEVFATDAEEVARWTALGIRASLATITQAIALPHDTLLVETEAGIALQLDLLPVGVPSARGYEWQAVYSSGTADPIVWFWGDEVSPSLTITRFFATLGPGSVLEGADVQENFAQRWGSLDITYRGGVP